MKSILKKILTVEERVNRLRHLSQTMNSFESYLSSARDKDVAERNIQVAIESCLDIGKILIAIHHLKEPSDNKGVFMVLAESGIIETTLLKFLIPMAGTRNILVHGYDRIDDALIYGIIQKHLSDFENFIQQVRSHESLDGVGP
ncbi:type VII toxin-antitoxin system HepT family RNase toxin [Desulfotignum balticum]|uniref:type VII toxin-antitoxin system HepT family RNase toxin n=1 Tax=Desulfotignum balticum TaxID=115781 RepID=UPI000420467C|nr:DUF86 domain-containing protein [Desulfotignum balticum]